MAFALGKYLAEVTHSSSSARNFLFSTLNIYKCILYYISTLYFKTKTNSERTRVARINLAG